jgi:sugar O-acyltransferase (sialic acid O-acetyltransferase NeuD family)
MEEIIIYGTGKLAQMVYYLLKESREYEAVGFTADQEYCTRETFLSLPLIAFDHVDKFYPPDQYKMLTVIGGLGGTEIRKTMFQNAKEKGYNHINYIHPTAVIEGSVEMGENNIIFPYTILGFSGKMGDNNIVREKVYLGHDFILGDHCFIGVGCNIGGESNIGDLTYIAMDTTVSNNIIIQAHTFIGIGSLVLKNIEISGGKYYGRPARAILKG